MRAMFKITFDGKYLDIGELSDLMDEKGIGVLELQKGDTKIKIDRSAAVPAAPLVQEPKSAEIAKEKGEVRGKAVKSPMVGLFYAAPSPDAKPFVSVGDKVKKGDVLCIVEAMKLMNEIVSEFDGEIVKVCAEDSQVVEYGQPLFIIA